MTKKLAVVLDTGKAIMDTLSEYLKNPLENEYRCIEDERNFDRASKS